MENQFFSPLEITQKTVENAEKKVANQWQKTIFLSVLAGAFIAFASEGSNMAAYNLLADPAAYGLGKALAGSLFGTGLMLVLLCGAELFTGNNLIILGVLEHKVKLSAMLRNWLLVYFGNLLGSLLVALMIVHSGQLGASGGLLGGMTIKIAAGKVGLSFLSALLLGVMCNWLVCLAVWMSTGARDISGKIWAIFFPIWLFITSGFEHSVANMYYIPAGILAKNNPGYVQAAMQLGVTADQLTSLNWPGMFLNNLLPVTLGNIIGGGFFVAAFYWFIYCKKINMG